MVNKIPRSLAALIIDEFVYNKQHRDIMKRRILDEIKYESLAEEFSMSVRHVKQIVKDETDNLKPLM